MPFFCFRVFKALCCLLLSVSATVLLAQQDAVPMEYASLEGGVAPPSPAAGGYDGASCCPPTALQP
jgi:hypothetical protein